MKKIYYGLTMLTMLIVTQNGLTVDTLHPTQEIPYSYQFNYQDIKNFKKVLNVAEHNGDTLDAVNEYFANGSKGMKAWIERYNTKPQLIVKAIKYFPEYYQYLAQLEQKLVSFEEKITKGLNGLVKLYPSSYVHIPPVYYFILFSGGGSVEMTANMISIDYFGHHEKLNEKEFDRVGGLFPKGPFALVNVDLIPQVAVHETAHLLQSYQQGEVDYVSIYKEGKQTMQAYAIREGGADFLAFLGSGLVDENKIKYGDEHEEELWNLFKPLLHENVNSHPGWFSGQSPENPEWPWQIGYYMGFKIVEHYYNSTDDKEAALKLIFNSNQDQEFEKFISKYDEKW